jgi:hypothetical protein
VDLGGGRNSMIELHDSEVAGITQSGSSIVVLFRPAYVHHSEGRPAIDPGTGWLQDLDLIVSEADLISGFSEMPRTVLEGSMSVDDEVFSNVIPLPLDVRGAVRFSAESWNEERLIIQGTRATIVPKGEARYLEEVS